MRPTISWDVLAKEAFGMDADELFEAVYKVEDGLPSTHQLAKSLGADPVSLRSELRRRGYPIRRRGAPEGNANRKSDLSPALFGFESEDEMIAQWRNDGLSGGAIAMRLSRKLKRRVPQRTVYGRLNKLKEKGMLNV
jgi:hypothetical protein